ncbi:MAG: sigma-54-dependent Fis family transcriptional regulator [Neptuniibacter sp.]
MTTKLNSTTQDVVSYISSHFHARSLKPDSIISSSWCRSVVNHGLDPTQKDLRAILTKNEVAEQINNIEDFFHIAKVGSQNLSQRLNGAGYAVILANKKGLTLYSSSHSSSESDWKSLGITAGAVWQESLSGTSAIATTLIEEKALTVHLSEHFMINNTPLSCSAAPIFDSSGNLIAILGASCINSKHEKDEQQVVLQLVSIYAKWIENTYLRYLHKNSHIISIKPNTTFQETDTEILIAVSDQETVIGANKSAIKHFKSTTGKNLIGASLSEIIKEDLEGLLNRPKTVCISVCCGKEVQVNLETPPKAITAKRSSIRHTCSISTKTSHPSLAELTGYDNKVKNNVDRLVRVIDRGIPILITGETGSGKEAFARAIHDCSERANAPFVAINCASIPESLIESELFGYRSGSFTGANKKGMKGKLELANGGTLFLDEIGDMPVLLQTRLLRVLAEREVLPLGADSPVQLDINIISATHQDILNLVHEKLFREDLYYRLNGMTLELPPLRERSDKRHIIHSIIEKEANGEVSVSREALNKLVTYHWPGNFRQLINASRYAIAISLDGIIDLDCLPAEINNSQTISPLIMEEPASKTEQTPPLKTELRSTTLSKPNEGEPLSASEKRNRRKAHLLLETLKRHKWSITNAAEELGTSRSTIYRQMKKFDIDQPNHIF